MWGHSDIQGASKHMGPYEYVRDAQTPLSVHMPPYFHTPPYIWMPPICSESFNRVFILLYHKMFSYFRARYWGLSDLEGLHMSSNVHMPHVCLDAPCMFGCPHTFGHPPYVWTSTLYIWITPYVWMPPVSLNAPTHLYACMYHVHPCF